VLPDAAVVVEVKGARFSDSARQGRAGRVETQSKRIIGKALDQNIRAWNYLSTRTDGVKRSSDRKLPLDPMTRIVGLIVTLDHIDPFYGDLAEDIRSKQGPFKNAIMSVSDMLMIVDILGTPAECFAYVAVQPWWRDVRWGARRRCPG
jgi:hypothetical protein